MSAGWSALAVVGVPVVVNLLGSKLMPVKDVDLDIKVDERVAAHDGVTGHDTTVLLVDL